VRNKTQEEGGEFLEMKNLFAFLLRDIFELIGTLVGFVTGFWLLRDFHSKLTLSIWNTQPFLSWCYVLALVVVGIFIAYKSLTFLMKNVMPISKKTIRIVTAFIFGFSCATSYTGCILLIAIMFATIAQK
jgi:uncharacterized protein YneF (UPF0154 family)